MSAIKDKNIQNFEIHWDRLSQEEKLNFIQTSGDLEPDTAIQIVLKGIDSSFFSIRTQAREALKKIQSSIHDRLADSLDTKKRFAVFKDSAKVCSRLFSRIRPGISLEDQHFLIKTLLGFEGAGAMFAFKALSMRKIAMSSMEKIILSLPDQHRLNFLLEYFKAGPELRLRFAPALKQMILSVKQLDAVVHLYARLFDSGQDTDLFLYNLHPDLRNPEILVSKFVRSDFPQERILGLKALAMTAKKIRPGLLLDMLTPQTDPEIRRSIYKIVENSEMGTYPELFDPILNLLEKTGRDEAFHAFKALIISGKLSLTELIDVFRVKHPYLIEPVCTEISALSRISFVFIQDMALDRHAYAGINQDLNQAAIYGIIKKRPERVVGILQNHFSQSSSLMAKEMDAFIQKTKQILGMEGRVFEERFQAVYKQLEAPESAPQPGGILKSIFSSSGLTKKIESLKKDKSKEMMDFSGETIIAADFSSMICTHRTVCFDLCTVKETSFSKASFSNAYFNGSIIYQTDFQKATFDQVCFDHAAFINVDARSAVFKNCSFQGALIHNCNFNDAVMSNAFFIGATVSKTSFEKTDLSCSCFAYAHIRGVSFVSSNLDQSDFTGLRSQFCRFPNHIRPSLLKTDADLNARKYQLSPEDIPKFGPELLSKLNMLVLGEFIHYGEMKFVRQNKYSLLTAFDIFKQRQADLFQIIPCLLHENMALPGSKKELDPSTPCGIFDYHPDPETLETISKYARGKKYEPAKIQSPAIEGLFTIGSIGSVAQANDSDIDYWVCIHEDRFLPHEILLLEKKLRTIEEYSMEEFHTQVTFFLVDIVKARNNDFGYSTLESSGSAQAMLLKEEFYRAMIHVAGKLPLWAVLPTAISKAYYQPVLNMISGLPDYFRYIDLGDIHAIPAGEFFGASIWQMFKGLKSPFKSILKMALLEKYICEHGEKPLLCNIYKDGWMNSGGNLWLFQNDPYYIMVDHLFTYFEAAKDTEAQSLLLTCFFLKLGISGSGEMDNTVFGLRKILLDECIKKWNWSREKMFKAGNYSSWPYKNIAGLSGILESYMIKKYRFLSKTLENFPDRQTMISDEDRTVLGRKVYSELSKKPDKISKLLLVCKSDLHINSLHLRYARTKEGNPFWELINKNSKMPEGEEILMTAGTIEEIGAWLIVNQVYHDAMAVSLIPNPIPVSTDDIRRLFKTIHEFFQPLIRKTVSFDHLLKKEALAGLLICANLYAQSQQRDVAHYSLLMMNTWGEMFQKTVIPEKGLPYGEDLKRSVLRQLALAELPEKTAFCLRGQIKPV